MATDLATLKAALTAATQGEWEWWNGCSWWRLGVNDRNRSRVIEPYTAPDGHPDLIVSPEDRAFIVAAHNMMPGLIAEVERLREAVAAAEAAGEARGLERAAKAVIRLVAEACCEAVTWMPGTISQLPLFQDGFKHGRACAVATIRSTFLLPEARDGD